MVSETEKDFFTSAERLRPIVEPEMNSAIGGAGFVSYKPAAPMYSVQVFHITDNIQLLLNLIDI